MRLYRVINEQRTRSVYLIRAASAAAAQRGVRNGEGDRVCRQEIVDEISCETVPRPRRP